MSGTLGRPATGDFGAPFHLTSHDNGWDIAIEVAAGGVILAATVRWNDKGADAGFLASLSRRLVGMTLREARDHGVQYACLDAKQGAAAVSGVVLPANHSPTSRAAERALRTTIDSAKPPDPTQWNFEDRGFSPAWSRLPEAERLRRIETLMAAYLESAGHPGALTVTEIDKYDRVFVQFQPEFPLTLKPRMLMQMEHHIRTATGERIELFVSEMKDNNRIRRL